jgi:predicted permease
MGASRAKIVGQLLCEALALALLGGVAAVPLSLAALHFLILLFSQSGVPEALPGFLTVRLDWPVLLFGLGLSLLTGLLFGVYPAWEAARVEPVKVLNQESGNFSEARHPVRVQKLLVCAQVMISVMVLVPTGLFLKNLLKLKSVDLGFWTENLMTFILNPTEELYTPERRRVFYDEAEQKLAAIPGVTGVTMRNISPIRSLAVEGYTGERAPSSGHDEISPGFFKAMGISLIAGREFNERDNLAGQQVAIISEKFAETYFAGQNPIGRKIGFKPYLVKDSTGRMVGTRPPISDTEIVGVVKDFRLGAKEWPSSACYTPWRQDRETGFMMVFVRYALPKNQAFTQVRTVLRALDASVSPEPTTMEDLVTQQISGERQMSQLAGVIAVLASALAMIGLYGVMAYSVARRTREIGIRMAIGARPAGIRQMVLREMLLVLTMGLVLGIPSALAIAKMIRSQLFGVSAYDPFVVAGASLALGLVAFVAAYLPAWRASRIDPLDALGCE